MIPNYNYNEFKYFSFWVLIWSLISIIFDFFPYPSFYLIIIVLMGGFMILFSNKYTLNAKLLILGWHFFLFIIYFFINRYTNILFDIIFFIIYMIYIKIKYNIFFIKIYNNLLKNYNGKIDVKFIINKWIYEYHLYIFIILYIIKILIN